MRNRRDSCTSRPRLFAHVAWPATTSEAVDEAANAHLSAWLWVLASPPPDSVRCRQGACGRGTHYFAAVCAVSYSHLVGRIRKWGACSWCGQLERLVLGLTGHLI